MFLWFFLISFIGGWGSDIVLPPTGGSGETYGFIMLQGAEINNTEYEPLMIVESHHLNTTHGKKKKENTFWNSKKKKQHQMNKGPPKYISKSIIRGIARSIAGQCLPSTSPVFIGGHSLGGASLQAWIYANQYDYMEKTGIKTIAGQVLMGAFIQRQFRNQTTQLVSNYSIPTLTIGGSLDGLCRVSRIIEQVYVQLGIYACTRG
ncbi:hypothetical protein RFI_27289 [Reticulomyxa filosa]|uniref:Fungal lipase-like domain-containing protein n=1 Tax=Reticulomyxa filosa TaxID=46433 RepID=X6M7X9_RETFI|nr:hypothetical protein RFI_27289 [Reticulomyxa filosa]|eukprot:ETO10088.1 hypothetical protein RFI_27289 [Reticulomyxa filosa]